MATWRSKIAKKMLVIWLCRIAKRLLAILRQPIAKHMLAILATSYRLKRNNRVSSFCWTRGSKQFFSHMFLLFQLLLSVFSQNRYLLISQRQYIVHAPPCFWNRTRGFLEARCSWESSSSITTGKFFSFPNFAEGVCCERPLNIH